MELHAALKWKNADHSFIGLANDGNFYVGANRGDGSRELRVKIRAIELRDAVVHVVPKRLDVAVQM
jgi:hypothetical protein